MIWQQEVRVIVMLTAEKEGGQVKAHNYWTSCKYNNLKLNYLSEHRATIEPRRIRRHYSHDQSPRSRDKPTQQDDSPVTNTPPSLKVAPRGEEPYVIVRRFTLSRTDMPFERMREITQLQYSHWPDFGAPAHPTHVLGLVEQCDAVVRSSQGSASAEKAAHRPIVVHCSAGCGRTGTFCTVDSVLDMLRQQRAYRKKNASPPLGRPFREPTPMEVDAAPRKSPDKTPSAAPSGGGGDFFSEAMSISPQTPQAPAQPFPATNEAWLARDDVDLVEKAVEEFRLQRLSMVQSLRQFVLCYESVLEWLAAQPGSS